MSITTWKQTRSSLKYICICIGVASAKAMAEKAERDALDEQAWRRAGTTPPPRTFNYDPTKVRPGKLSGFGGSTQPPAAAPQIKRRT